MRLIFINIMLSLLCVVSYSQDINNPSDTVVYDAAFEFKDGVFLSIQQFKNNNPIHYAATNLPNPGNDNFNDILQEKGGFQYFDAYGNEQFVNYDSIWGYAYKDNVYIAWGGNFHLLSYIGSISHFVAIVTVYNDYMDSPFYDPYYYPYNTYSNHSSREAVQLLLDVSSGNILDFTPENVACLLKNEPELKDEFLKLRKRKRRKMMFYYVHRYNERNPLYVGVGS